MRTRTGITETSETLVGDIKVTTIKIATTGIEMRIKGNPTEMMGTIKMMVLFKHW